jgi:hypothetical protein
LEARGGRLRAEEDAHCDRCCDCEGHGGEEAEDVLDAHPAGVHGGVGLSSLHFKWKGIVNATSNL